MEIDEDTRIGAEDQNYIELQKEAKKRKRKEEWIEAKQKENDEEEGQTSDVRQRIKRRSGWNKGS